ncbi:MAG: leucine-rich repeat domain-containing protein [Bacteroidaceae bacterium]|nr:leucine-rich repeat domain-containing protein [Bacteroidaceae bacterium]
MRIISKVPTLFFIYPLSSGNCEGKEKTLFMLKFYFRQLLVVMFALLCSMTASAYDFEADGIYYKVTSNNTVSVTRKLSDNSMYVGSLVIPELVNYLGNTYKVTSIQDGTFDHCEGITNVILPNSILKIGEIAFRCCKKLVGITIPNSVTTIEGRVFSGCTNLRTVVIGNSLINIGYSMFQGCSGLESVKIGDGVTYIGENSFKDCTSLKKISIPNSVTSIGGYAFMGCSALKSIYLVGTTPPEVASDCFAESQYAFTTVYVPQGSLAAYQAADTWKDFLDIQEFEVTAIEDIEDVTPAFEITSNGIQFIAADGKTVAVYTVAGALVEKIDNYTGKEISLDKGVYIVRVGDKTMKVKL